MSYCYINLRYHPYIIYDPWAQGRSLAANTTDLSSSISATDINSQLIYSGIMLENEGKIDGAISFYKNLISNDKLVNFAITQLAYIKNKYSKNEILNYLQGLSAKSKYSLFAAKLVADMYLQNSRFNEAINLYYKIIKNYPDNRQAVNSRFAELFAYLNIKKDNLIAGQLLSVIKSLNLKDDEYLISIALVEHLLNGSNEISLKNNIAKQGINKEAEKDEVINTPKEYSLLGNYPNPFNPTTNIVYNLPRSSLVEITIYNILGNKVRSFNIPSQSAGIQQLTWDGKDLNSNHVSSGTYLYHFKAKSLEGESEVFEKSGKLLILK